MGKGSKQRPTDRTKFDSNYDAIFQKEEKQMTRHDELEKQALEFHCKYPEVWDQFVEFTFNRINKGFKHYSVYSIMERIRWEMAEGGDGETEFKINNNHSPFYSRWFMTEYPEHLGFFRTRVQKSQFNNPTGLEATPDMVI